MKVVERDKLILREVERWRVCGSRHIRFLAGFSGQRATDRRLKLLIEAEYLERRKYLYGVPSIYFVTSKGKKLIQSNARPEKVKVEQIVHDMTVLDSAIYFMQKENLSLQDIMTENSCISRTVLECVNTDRILFLQKMMKLPVWKLK